MNRRIVCSLLIGILLLSDSSFAIDAQQLFDQANAEYVQGHYSAALHEYHQILREYGGSAALFFNLGRTYQEMGQPGKAILNYERAKNLAPRDADILASLREIKKNNSIFTQSPQGMRKYVKMLDIHQWAWSGLIGLILFSLLLILSLVVQWKKLGVALSFTCFSLLLTTGALTLLWPDLSPSIVTKDNAPLLASPINGADLLQTLREGQKVYQLKSHGKYCYVRDDNGHKGWLPHNTLEPVADPEIFR